MALIFFILGLIIGSFLNVVVYRLNVAEDILGRSYCPTCKHKIRWYDNIPLLSFAVLKAKCRDCGEKISWQYPLVEFLTGAIFAFTAVYFFSIESYSAWAETIFYLVVFSIMMVVFLYDLKFMEVPMIMLWIAIGWTVAFFLFAKVSGLSFVSVMVPFDLISGLIGGVIAFLFFFSLSYLSKETWMGYGDAYIGFLIGLLVGWQNILLVLTFSFAIGALFSIALIVFGRKTMKSQVPFAPFLVAGTIVAIFIAQTYPGIEHLLSL